VGLFFRRASFLRRGGGFLGLFCAGRKKVAPRSHGEHAGKATVGPFWLRFAEIRRWGALA
jgi:hypothetical protein